MNNLNSIVDYLKVFNNINKRPAQEPRTMAQEPRNMYSQGQLVQNTADGSRPGYGGDWKNTTNYKKTREAMKKGLVYDLKTKRMRKHKPLTGATGYVNNPKGRSKIEIKDWTLEQKANLETWMDNTGSTVKDFNKLSQAPKQNIKYGMITGIRQTPEFAKKLESAVTKQFRNWLSKQDPKTLTADSVDDLIKQSKIKTTSTNQRSGLVNAMNRIMEEKEFSKFKNIQLGRVYSQKNINQLSDDLLKAYAEDDIRLVMDTKHKTSISDIRSNKLGALDKAIKNTGLDEETIFNLLDDRDAYVELEQKIATTKGRPRDLGQAKIYKQAENWIVKNSQRYADPDKFKKAFLRTFDKNSDIVQKLTRPDKTTLMHVPFSDWFRTDIIGSSEQAMRGHHKPAYSANQLDTIFKTAIYTNNKNVRNKIINELTKVIPEKSAKNFPNKRSMDIHRMLNENPLLKKFGLNQKIDGPIARLLAKEVGDDMLKQISRLRRPWLGTYDLIHYLKDRVNPKYKSMFEEAAQGVRYAQTNQWPEARKSLKLSESIMFDHKVPKALVKLGYADEIEYIKLNPTSAQFNAKIKNNQFDKPLIRLVNQWEKAKTVDAKSKVVGEMNELKDTFSKKYGNYLDDVKINVDKTGKPIFSSKAPVVTKKTDLVKSLETSLQHEKFPTMSKLQKSNFLSSFWCGTRKASGGRVSFASGSGCPDSVKQKNFLRMTSDVRAGKITGEAAEQIAKNTAKVVAKAGSKSALASIFGPYGIGIDVIYEVGAVGFDVLGGKPWKEAVQDNWIAGAFMPGTGQEEFHKRLFEEYPVGYEGDKTKKYPEAKPYGSGLDLKEAYDKKLETIERMKANTTWRGRAEAEKRLPELERDLRGIAAQLNALGSIREEGSPEHENYMAAVTEARDADKAKSFASKQKLKYALDPPKSDRAIPYKRGEPVKIDFKLPSPAKISETPLNADQVQEYAEYHRNVGDLEPRGELPQWYVDEIQNKEKWRQLFEQRGIRGSQDWKGATGGIASLKKKW